MSLEFTVEVWDALRSHIETTDRKDAADTLVTLLIENNYEATDIKESFRGDKDIINALKFYIDQHEDDDDSDEYDIDDDEYLYRELDEDD